MDSVFTCGSICDGKQYKVEVKTLLEDTTFSNFLKGQAVEVTGTVKKYGNYPPFIQISSKGDYKIGSEKIDFKDVLKCYENIKKL